MKVEQRPIGVDLFAGVGGMSLGFEQAGFDVVAGFDIELHNVETYKKNFPARPAFQCDLSKATGDQLRKKAKLGKKRIDVVFGGPPCQGFSEIGKRLLANPRNQLLFHFSRLVRQLKPRYFVLENVEGLTFGDSKDLLNSFLLRVKRAGYDVVEPVRVLDAADYGVPQRRLRLFVLGFERGLPSPSYPPPCPLRNSQGRIVEPKVIDAIRDLQKVVDRQDAYDSDVFLGRLGRPSYYAKLLRGEVADPDDQSVSRERNGDGLSGCLRTWHSDEVVERFSDTIPVRANRSANTTDWQMMASHGHCVRARMSIMAATRQPGRFIQTNRGASRPGRRRDSSPFRTGSNSIQPDGTDSSKSEIRFLHGWQEPSLEASFRRFAAETISIRLVDPRDACQRSESLDRRDANQGVVHRYVDAGHQSDSRDRRSRG